MAKILEDISRTFNEFLLLPNLTDERCIPSKVSLKNTTCKIQKRRRSKILCKCTNGFCYNAVSIWRRDGNCS